MLTYFVNTSAPLLIARFSEREQSVKLEVWSTYARLLNIVKLLDTSSIKSSITPGSPLTSRASREDTPTSLKRKRGAQESAMTLPSPPEEASLISAIAAQSPAVCKSILKQITPKNISSSQTGFTVLDALVSVLNGGLENQLSSFAPAIGYALPNASNPSQLDSSAGTVTSLKTTVLSFLAKVFISHSPASFGPSLKSQLVPCLVACTADKFNKIASGGFTAISALVKSLRAHKDAAPALSDQTAIVDILYKATASRLEASATDSEVRDSAVQTMGDLLANVGDALSVPAQQPLNLLTESLRREVTRVAAVRTSSKVAASSIMQSRPELSAWIAQSTPDVATFLRQSNRVLKVDSFACLPILIGAAGPSLPAPVAETVLQNTVTFISIDDLLLLPSAVNVLSALLQAQPQATVKSKTFIAALQQVYQLVESPLLQSGVALDSFLNFFSNLAQVSTPTDIIDKLKKTTSRAGPRCIGAVVQSKPELANEVADGFVTSASASKSSETSVIFSLYTLGEIGRVPCVFQASLYQKMCISHMHSLSDYQGAARAFQIALDKMNSGSDEEVRSAASFALGNLAVGSEDLVDQVIAHISSGDAHQAVLALHALKEFITHAQAPSIAARADSLWQPLFSICSIEGPPPPEASLPDDAKPEQKKARDQRIEAQFKENEPVRTKWMQTETSRSVAAECLGKITLLDPPRFLPQLQARVGDKLAGIRCAVITGQGFIHCPVNFADVRVSTLLAIRFTLVDTSKEFEALLVPTVVSFLNLMRDQDLVSLWKIFRSDSTKQVPFMQDVRRIALSTFNSAASHKPHLIRDSLSTLLPLLFEQTIVNPSFVRIVEMGPFKHKVDDGLEPRKAAYEACYTLLDTCLGRFDALEMLDCVLRGLTDDNEIRAICYLMLIRLAQVSPAATTLRELHLSHVVSQGH